MMKYYLWIFSSLCVQFDHEKPGAMNNKDSTVFLSILGFLNYFFDITLDNT